MQISPIADFVSEFFLWWKEELTAATNAMLPGRTRKIILGTDDKPGNAPANATFAAATPLNINGVGGPVPFLSRARRVRHELCIPQSSSLTRLVSLPPIASRRIAEAMLLQMEQVTPFSPDQVYAGFHVRRLDRESGCIEVEHVIVKRRIVEELREKLRIAGLEPSSVAVRVETGSGNIDVPVALGANLRNERRPLWWARGVLIASCVALVAKASALVEHHWQIQLAVTDSKIASVKDAAKDVTKRVRNLKAVAEQNRALKSLQASVLPRTVLLEKLSQLLPDDVWLTELRVVDRSVTFDGYARSSSELIQLLARTPGFARAKLTSPVVFDQGQKKERVSVQFELVRPDQASARIEPPGQNEMSAGNVWPVASIRR